MSLYNQLFGFDPLAKPLLLALEINPFHVPRFRDCFLMEGKIVIYTRTGGANRIMNDTPWIFKEDSIAPDSWENICVAHPDFIGSEDDEYDSTYAFWFFRYPDEFAVKLEELAGNHSRPRPSTRWKALFAEMGKEVN